MSWFSGSSRTNSTNSEGHTSRTRGNRTRSRRCAESPGQLSLDLGLATDLESS